MVRAPAAPAAALRAGPAALDVPAGPAPGCHHVPARVVRPDDEYHPASAAAGPAPGCAPAAAPGLWVTVACGQGGEEQGIEEQHEQWGYPGRPDGNEAGLTGCLDAAPGCGCAVAAALCSCCAPAAVHGFCCGFCRWRTVAGAPQQRTTAEKRPRWVRRVAGSAPATSHRYWLIPYSRCEQM